MTVHRSDDDACLAWRTADDSGGGDCVEVAPHAGRVLVRDSKDPDGPLFALGPGAWAALLAPIKDSR